MARTRFGLLGAHLTHSYSPMIHEYLGDYAYPLYEKAPEAVADFVQNGPFDGLNVTIPYKKTVLPFCTRVSDAAQAIGSVNTLLRMPDGSLFGDNTDFYGFSRMVASCGVCPKGKKALVLGSGGASLTVQAVLGRLGAQVVVISRSGPDNYQNLARHRDAQMIVNTTPVGMYPQVGASPVDLRRFPECQAVLDLIYNPAWTDLLLQARALGIACENGLTMLVAQAKRAAELFLEKEIDDGAISDIGAQVRRRSMNLALIGMPGCGKSTVGRALAQRMGREFVDLDAAIEATAGMSIPELFKLRGEEAFRRLEHQTLTETAKKSGLVIATGGGVVTRPQNRTALARNSVIVYLRRDPALLPTDGRPVSQRDGVLALYQARAPLYESWCDLVAENCTDSPEQAAQAVLNGWSDYFAGRRKK